MKLEELVKELSLPSFDQIYMAGLYSKYLSHRDQKQSSSSLLINQNFFPSALLTSEERESLLGVKDYTRQIGDRKKYKDAAKGVVLLCNPMNGGLGSSVKREQYLKNVAKRHELGAKGTDLFLSVKVQGFSQKGDRVMQDELLSVTELKYINAIESAHCYAKVIMQELVNEDSFGPITHFLDDTTFLFDRVDQGVSAQRRAYREVIEQTDNMELASTMIKQTSLPVIDVDTGELTTEFKAPGGHGQLGSMILQEALTVDLPEDKVFIRTVFNGDGINNSPDEFIVGWMAEERIPMVMITTTKTPLDKKGGLMGVEKISGGKTRAQMLEMAQADANDQRELFLEMGLSQGDPQGQFFNTNVAVLNYNILQPFLRELKKIIGSEKFNEIVTPDLIANEKDKDGRKIIQLEGAMGSALLNLNGYVTTTDHKEVRALLKKYKLERLLFMVNVDPVYRTKFFTPIKYAYDFWLYAHSDHFEVDPLSGVLVNKIPGHLPGFGRMDPFYEDVQNVVDAMFDVQVSELTELNIVGKIYLERAILKGRVTIESQANRSVYLNDIKGFSSSEDDRILLEDVRVIIDPELDVTIEPHP